MITDAKRHDNCSMITYCGTLIIEHKALAGPAAMPDIKLETVPQNEKGIYSIKRTVMQNTLSVKTDGSINRN